jgi:chemotaxis protein MotB
MNRVQQGARAPRVHTDDWLITYADMITLLLCFFVIFFVILSSRKLGLEEPHAVQAATPAAHDAHPARAIVAKPVAALSGAEISAFNSFESSGADLADAAAAGIRRPAPAKPTTGPEPRADRISLLEFNSSTFFPSGSADLNESGKPILRDVAVQLKSDAYRGYQIVVEGHTDDTPIATVQFSSNWELATARAAAVVHFLLDQGLAAQRLRAAGYADTQPKLPNRDASGAAIPENQAQNRRVVIRLEKIEAPE